MIGDFMSVVDKMGASERPLVVEEADYVDEVSLHDNLTRWGYRMVVTRTYRKIAEAIELRVGSPLMQFRKALQGGRDL